MVGTLNPQKVTWQHGGKNVDGSAFDPTLFNGWEGELDGTPALSIPIGWETDGTYEFPLGSLSLANGQHALRLRLLAKNGVNSDWSNAVQFTVDMRKPNPPVNLAAV
jgi:hypothetical protein